MKKVILITLVLFFCFHTQDEASGQIIVDYDFDTSVPCEDLEKLENAIKNSGTLGMEFDDMRGWNNCSSPFVVNEYFDKLSRITNKPQPHSAIRRILGFSQFKNGLPNGKATAFITTTVSDIRFNRLTDDEKKIKEEELDELLFSSSDVYYGYLKDGLPEGKGTLIYTILFPNNRIEGEWTNGCINWEKDVEFESFDLSYSLKRSLLSDRYKVTVHHYINYEPDSTNDIEVIESTVEKHLASCVPGLARADKGSNN